jgi:hypothetical protein
VNPHDDPALAAAFAETEAIYTAALDARIQSGAAFGGSVSLPDSRSDSGRADDLPTDRCRQR